MNSANRESWSSVRVANILTRRRVRGSMPLMGWSAAPAPAPAPPFGRKNICSSGTSPAFCQEEFLPRYSQVSAVTRSSLTQATSVGSSMGPYGEWSIPHTIKSDDAKDAMDVAFLYHDWTELEVK